MTANWTFGRRLVVGFAVTVCAFLAVVIVGQRASAALVESQRWVSHTHEVRAEIADVIAGLTEAETSARGYAISGSERFLQPYQAAVAKMNDGYDRLRRVTTDNQNQQRRLVAVRPMIDERIVEFVAVIDARRSTGLDAAIARVNVARGQELTERIRRLLGEMDAEETELLEARRGAAHDAAALARGISLWGGLAIVAVTALIAAALIRLLNQRVGSVVHQIQSSSAELQTAASQQVGGTREQATAMTEISTTMTELLATSRQISDSAARVSQIAGQTGAAASGGAAIVDQGTEAAAMVRRQVDLIVNHMLELGKKSQQAGGVIDIVGELAEQTNILAINAAIEAAGAGEAGARFGVVADEIRKLADRVTTSTKAIRQILDDVRGAVSVTVMATETGSKAIDLGARQIEAMAAAFGQIAPLVASTVDAAREIELSTKQQSTAVEQVYVAISDVAQATRETEAASTQTLQTSKQLTAMSSVLGRLVQRAS
jgi:methyl-accepting chemotaxis protein